MTKSHTKTKYNWPKVKRKNINGVRHYVDDEYNIYHSVTRVVNHGKDLTGWYHSMAKQYNVSYEQAEAIGEYIKINAGIQGTKLHTLCEDYLNNNQVCAASLLPKAHFDNLKPYLDKINNIRGQEIQMFSKQLGLAGTVDCVAEYDGQLAIIDFKTSRKLKKEEWIESYYLQATAYSLMWEENTGEKIEEIRILMTAETGEAQVFESNRNNWIDKLHEKIVEFKDTVKTVN